MDVGEESEGYPKVSTDTLSAGPITVDPRATSKPIPANSTPVSHVPTMEPISIDLAPTIPASASKTIPAEAGSSSTTASSTEEVEN